MLGQRLTLGRRKRSGSPVSTEEGGWPREHVPLRCWTRSHSQERKPTRSAYAGWPWASSGRCHWETPFVAGGTH